MSKSVSSLYNYRKRDLPKIDLEKKTDKPWEMVSPEEGRRTRLFNLRIQDYHYYILRALAEKENVSMQELVLSKLLPILDQSIPELEAYLKQKKTAKPKETKATQTSKTPKKTTKAKK